MSTPDELRGRMSSIISIVTSNALQMGQFASGVIAAWLGAKISDLLMFAKYCDERSYHFAGESAYD